MKNKPFVITVLCLMIISIYGLVGYKVYEWYIWRAPEYSSTTKKVLLSSKVNQLNEQQEDVFWQCARNIAEKELKFDSEIDDDSLRVEKAPMKHVYHLWYTCKGEKDGETVSYDTEFYLIPRSSLKVDRISYRSFTSEQNDTDDDDYY